MVSVSTAQNARHTPKLIYAVFRYSKIYQSDRTRVAESVKCLRTIKPFRFRYIIVSLCILSDTRCAKEAKLL